MSILYFSSLNIYLGVNFSEANCWIYGTSILIRSFKVFITCWVCLRESNTSCIFLWSTTSSSRINIDKRLAIRSFCMLILHVSVECWVRQICLITIVTLVISTLHIILWSSLLLFSIRILIIIAHWIIVFHISFILIVKTLVITLKSKGLRNFFLLYLKCLLNMSCFCSRFFSFYICLFFTLFSLKNFLFSIFLRIIFIIFWSLLWFFFKFLLHLLINFLFMFFFFLTLFLYFF